MNGPGSTAVAALMNPLLGLAVIVIAVLGIVAVQRGAAVTELLAPLSLALVTAFIVFNKVGSPQYMTWLAVPIILGLATRSMGHGRVVPVSRGDGPGRRGAHAGVLSRTSTRSCSTSSFRCCWRSRCGIFCCSSLFGWSVSVLGGLLRPFVIHESLDDKDAWLPAAWPFTDRPSAARQLPTTTHALRTAPPQ